MNKPIPHANGLVSVVIPCYNHGKYLTKAIESIFAQTYTFFEIIVVDDGSVDDTKMICLNYPNVSYIYQKNAGLSAARNTGIDQANGDYLVFLDADDWLLERALEINIDILSADMKAAFVSGGYELYHEPSDKTWIIQQEILGNYYSTLLEKNFIGMHATIMYRSWIFDKIRFNLALRYCEDYDVYLQITKSYPTLHHTQLIAVYRKHDNNMSSNFTGMLRFALKVLSFQKKSLKTSKEKESYTKGINNWKKYYSKKIYERLIEILYDGKFNLDKKEIKLLKKYNEPLYKKFRWHLKEVETRKKKHS